jgi:hypothetical protein
MLLGASAAAGGGLMLAGCGSAGRPLSKLPPPTQAADITILNRLLDVEHLVVTAYVAAIPRLSGHPLRAAMHFLQQELSHVQLLSTMVRSAGQSPHGPKPRYDLGHPRSQTQLLELLRRVEDAAINAYLDAVPKLAHEGGRQTAASIIAVEAQHASIIRRDLGLSPVPAALVAGAQ